MKSVYLNIDDQGKVLDLNFESGTFYCEVDEAVTIDDIKISLDFERLDLFWRNNCLIGEPKKSEETLVTKAELDMTIAELTEMMSMMTAG